MNQQAGRQTNRTHPDKAAKRKKKNLSEDKLRDLWDNIKKNIFIYRGAWRRRGRERGRKETSLICGRKQTFQGSRKPKSSKQDGTKKTHAKTHS